jgi:YjbE family integral membrane protein
MRGDALAVRSLQGTAQRCIIIGSVMRYAEDHPDRLSVKLLVFPYIKVIGGVLIDWIAFKLFLSTPSDEEESRRRLFSGLAHIRGGFVMGLDNVLAVAAASKGSLFLLLFGLALSIPLVVGTSTFLLKLMDRFPIIITLGAAVLGKVAGEMIITDPFIVSTFAPSKAFSYATEAFFVIAVIVTGKLLVRRKISKEERALALETGK